MRRRISLYIADRLVDIDEQNLVLFNYAMEELNNPTIVKNSYSQQVTLPGTAANNKIFGDYFRLDRVTGSGFNVLVRTPFKIFNELGEVIESGYCKLDSVQTKGRNVVSYSISLFGGLGGYFYALSYNEDGTARNLGDLAYEDGDGNSFVPNETDIDLVVRTINYCWLTLNDGFVRSGTEWANVVNFAPCYNGVPSDFDANKALVSNNQYLNITPSGDTSKNDRPHPDSGGVYLVSMETPKDADEVRDYRTYLQRPILSVKAFVDALVARGGFSASEDAYDVIGDDMWVTLQLPSRESSYTGYSMGHLFDGTMTPADLLISLAKSFGLVFLADVDGVTMMTRNEFYSGAKDIDLTKRIDVKDIKVTPMTFDAKWYIWQNEVKGAFADKYEDDWDRKYGSHKVNTNYDFNTDSKVLTDSLKTKGAVQSLEWSNMFQFSVGTRPIFPASFFEKVSFVGYNAAGSDSSNIDIPPYPSYTGTKVYYNEDFPLYDVFDKPQFYDSSRKGVDGAGVLLYFRGAVELPRITIGTDPSLYDRLQWHITDGDQDLFNLLNDGNHCWDMRGGAGERIYRLPHFSRWATAKSLDFGIPSEVDAPNVTPPSQTLYERFWRAYTEDRYDVDTTILRCKVNLGGMQVGQGLLRNLYWYDNSWWVLNKISNHSLTTYDLTECEFVRVQDKSNYTNGQE